MKVNKHKSYLSNNTQKIEYKKVISQIEYFIKNYNALLKSKIHKSFLNEFYLSNINHFDVTLVFSISDNLLIYIEPNKQQNNNYTLYFTEKNPQVFIQELANNFRLNITTHPSHFSTFSFPDSTDAFFTEVNYVNFPIPYEITKDNFISIFDYSIKLEQPGDSIISKFPGITIIMSSSNIKSYISAFYSTIENLIQFEIRKQYLNSELFRKALIHPQLKEIATHISDRRTKADNKELEYPFWEFEKDINGMRDIAKTHNITNNYVDEMLKDSQYIPISGSLLYYYSNPNAFMLQWILINCGLLLFIIVIITILPNNKQIPIQLTLSTIILTANGWVFYKKPDLVNISFWIIPSIICIVSLALIYLQNIISFLTT